MVNGTYLLSFEVGINKNGHYLLKRLYVFGGRGRTRTDADGRGRTREIFFLIFFNFFFILFFYFLHT